jgi:hypothetical protein
MRQTPKKEAVWQASLVVGLGLGRGQGSWTPRYNGNKTAFEVPMILKANN